MAPATRQWTVEEIDQLPEDGNRYEVIDGRLFVSPRPARRHQGLVIELVVRLHAYLAANPIGVVYGAPGGIDRSPTTWVEPDVFVLPLARGKSPDGWAGARSLLVIEILSPSSIDYDRVIKRELYMRLGIPEYWIVDADAKTVERWRPGMSAPEILRDRVEWQPDPKRPVCRVDLAELFARVEERDRVEG